MRAIKESRDEVQDIADVSSALSIEPPTATDTTTNAATDSETVSDKGA